MAAAIGPPLRVVTAIFHPRRCEGKAVVSCAQVYRLDAPYRRSRRDTAHRTPGSRERDDMSTESSAAAAAERAAALLALGAEAELRLLKRERKAERRLAAARETLAADEMRLERARQRVASSAAAVADAEARLREAQAARAAGPDSDRA